MIIGDIETTEKVEYEDLLKNYYEKMEIIEEQDKEIERLKEDNEYLNKVNIELSTEKNRLNNIIKDLEKYIRSNEWGIDYEHSNCRTHLLEILKGE